MASPPTPFAPLPGLVGFTHALRRAGLPVDQHRTTAFLAALELLDLTDPTNLYWAGRLTLCAQADDLPNYDEAFAAWFDPRWRPPPNGRPALHRMRSHAAALPDSGGNDAGAATGNTPTIVIRAPSDVEILRQRDIGKLTPAEQAHLAELFALLPTRSPVRRGLRHRPARDGVLDPRRTLRALLANGGEPVRLRRRHRADRPRRVVLLVDVSGSMSPYADALLRFAHVVTRRNPGTTEVFTLGTRLTRVSRQLRLRDPELALQAASRAVPDFAGGTRLGEGLHAFLNRWGQRGLARRAAVVLFSDGWERGDPTLLAESLARLRRLAHVVVWANPHAGNADYQPVQSGIAVALPHVDRLVAGHSLAALEAVLWEIHDA